MMEGSGISRLNELFSPSNDSASLEIKTATIKSIPPNISVQVDGDSEDTPSEGIVVAEHLTEHKRTISFSADVVGNVDGYHGSGNLRNLQIARKELTIHSDLKMGDKVIVAIANDGQLVYVLDKAVM